MKKALAFNFFVKGEKMNLVPGKKVYTEIKIGIIYMNGGKKILKRLKNL